MTRAKAMATRIFWTFILKDAPMMCKAACVALNKVFSFLETSIPMLIFLCIYAGNVTWTATRKAAPVAVRGVKMATRKARKAPPIIRGYFIQMRGVACAMALYGAKMGMYGASVVVQFAKTVSENVARNIASGWQMRKEIIAEQKAE